MLVTWCQAHCLWPYFIPTFTLAVTGSHLVTERGLFCQYVHYVQLALGALADLGSVVVYAILTTVSGT